MPKREFSFRDEKSDKFWNIEVRDAAITVTYGRSGTSGQTQEKTHTDSVAARAAADKLIAEKLKKGYVEITSNTGGGAAPPNPTAPSVAASSPVKVASTPTTPPSDAPNPSAESQPATPTPTTIAPIAVPDPSAPLERNLYLEAADYLWATWRPRYPLSKPQGTPKPFDLEAALKRLTDLPGKNSWQGWSLSKAKIAPVLSREEAHFWLVAATLPRAQQAAGGQWMAFSAADIESRFHSHSLSRDLSIEEASALLTTKPSHHGVVEAELVLLLAHLFAPVDAVEVLLCADQEVRAKNTQRYHDVSFVQSAADGFRLHLLPYLTWDEATALRERLRGEIDPASWPSDFYHSPKLAFHLAALLGLWDELLAVVQSWKDGLYAADSWMDHYHRPQEIVFGLGSGAEVASQMRRVGLKLKTPEHFRAWLAHTEFSDLDWARESVMSAAGLSYRDSAKDVAGALVQTLALAVSPDVAPPMLELMLESKAPRPAREWLDTHPAHAVIGLSPLAAGRGKIAEAAVDWLRALKKRGFEEHIRAASRRLPDEAGARIESQVLAYTEKYFEPLADADLPPALREAMSSDKTLLRSKPGWIGADDLPPLSFGERKLAGAHVEALLSALQKSKPEALHPLVRAVKESADRASLDAFVWKLFERWLSEGAPPKEKWAMLSVGYLGGDACALKLTPLIRAWPGESQHQRAVTGLECLRAIGTDTALMQINGIAQEVKFKGLQAKAIESMEGIASDRGLSRAQLEDRVVPDCDLDEKGTRILDFGPRQWKFVLGPDMKPLVREESGALSKPRPDLPKPSAKDDPAKAAAAVAEWKLLKKQIAEVAKIQAVRLEHAMVKGRLWTTDEFESLLVRHPLMVNLARLIVWEAAAGNRRTTFRVTEDGTYADANDNNFDLAAGEWAHIGIAHPLHLADAQKREWGELLSDYEIVPPFPQLGRAIYTLEGTEKTGKEITRFKDIIVPPQTVCFGLEKLGWERGPALDAGGFYEHYKQFESSGITACAVYEPGLFMGGQEYWEPQKIVEAYFVVGLISSRAGRWNYPEKTHALPLSEVDPVAISETLKDLTEITAKGQQK